MAGVARGRAPHQRADALILTLTPRLRLLIWALYDLANTFFAVAMLSFYFPLWIVEDRGAPTLVFSLALGGSMLLVALLMPICGAMSDATGGRVSGLRWTTAGCLIATAAIGFVDQLPLALGLFVVANICYQLGTVLYDAILWDLATPGELGAASGIGASFGYLGSMLGLICLWPFVRAHGHHAAFIPSAVLFGLFALPSLLLLRDRPAGKRPSPTQLLQEGLRRLGTTVRRARSYTPLWRFFVAAFFSLNAINTVLAFMAIYTKQALHFTESDVVRFFLWGQAFSVAGALVFGRCVRWWGARNTLMFIWCGWALALAGVACSMQARALWLLAPVIGFCLGATWSTSRVLIIQLSPKERLAEFLGLAGLLGRVASILGPLIWGLIVLDPSRYRQAVLALLALMSIGLWLLRRVPERAPNSP